MHICVCEHAIDCVLLFVSAGAPFAAMCTHAVSAVLVWYLMACAAQMSMCAVHVNIITEVETQQVGEKRQKKKTVQKSRSVR